MKPSTISKYIPVIIATLLVLVSFKEILFQSVTFNQYGEKIIYVLNDNILYASYGLGLTLLLIFFRKNAWKYVFTLVLIISFSPYLKFYSTVFSLSIFKIYVDVIAMTLLISHLLLNKEIIGFILDTFKSSELRNENNQEQKIERFQRKFSHKTKPELEKIVNDNFLVPEAIEAAKRLLGKNH